MSFELVTAVVVSVGALIDLKSRRIPNWLTLAALLGGLLVWVVREGAAGVPVALGGALLGLGLLLPFYVIRAVGAGDVKLLAGVGALLGPQALITVAIYGGLVGGAISAVVLARRGQLGRSLREIVSDPTRIGRCGAKAPYGIAIASGVYLSMLLPSVIH
jgi:prepilin peptidase CpaA